MCNPGTCRNSWDVSPPPPPVGWLLILMLVHLLHALTALPLWACYGIGDGVFAGVGVVLLVLGTQKLARRHLVPQNTVETMQTGKPAIT